MTLQKDSVEHLGKKSCSMEVIPKSEGWEKGWWESKYWINRWGWSVIWRELDFNMAQSKGFSTYDYES